VLKATRMTTTTVATAGTPTTILTTTGMKS